MVQLICGPKGSGKTKRLIDMANAEVGVTNGDIVFIDDDKRYMYDVKRQIRFVDVTEYYVAGEEKLYGFLTGILSSNFDITAIYLDALVHIVEKNPAELEGFITQLAEIMEKHNVKLVVNVSGEVDALPDSMKALVI